MKSGVLRTTASSASSKVQGMCISYLT